MHVVYLDKTKSTQTDTCQETIWNNGEKWRSREAIENWHGESDEFRLVEVLRYFARLDGVHRAHDDEQHVENLAEQKRRVLHSALEDGLVALRVRCPNTRWFYPQPEHRPQRLHFKKYELILIHRKIHFVKFKFTWKEMIHDVMTICDFGLMKLGRFADREAFSILEFT